jgi:hypothetical protein
VEKSSTIICATTVIKKTRAKENNRQRGEKFAQSGHPAGQSNANLIGIQ